MYGPEGEPILVETLERLATIYRATAPTHFNFTSIEWNVDTATVKGSTKSRAFELELQFVAPQKRVMSNCSLCGGGSYCPHAQASIMEMLDSEVGEQIEELAFARNKFVQAGNGKPAQTPPVDAWKTSLNHFVKQFEYAPHRESAPTPFPKHRELIYVVDWSPYSTEDEGLNVSLATRPVRPADAKPSKSHERVYRAFNGGLRTWAMSGDPLDVELAGMVSLSSGTSNYYHNGPRTSFRLTVEQSAGVIARLAKSGRLYAKYGYDLSDNMPPLRWLNDEPFELKFEIAKHDPDHLRLGIRAVSGEMAITRDQIKTLRPRFFVDRDNGLGILRKRVPHDRLRSLMVDKPILVPRTSAKELIAHTMNIPANMGVAFVDCDDVRPEQVQSRPRGRIHISAPYPTSDTLEAAVTFDYDGTLIPFGKTVTEFYDGNRHAVVAVDETFHEQSREFLQSIGLKFRDRGGNAPFSLTKKKLPAIVGHLIRAEWHVEADGKLYRTGTAFDLKVASGIDWFELQGKAHFDQTSIDLPRLLQSLKAGEKTVVLDDGTLGIIPEAWIKRFGGLTELGTSEGDTIQFGRSQVGLLDALLAEQGEVNVDEKFAAARRSLRGFDRIVPQESPAGFVGELRPYQKLAQGWFAFLRDLGFGGCLADDMGLGKTIQVLAMLEGRRQVQAGPSLIVVPRSLIFNWTAEAKKFAPRLRVLDQSHSQRVRGTEHLADFDLVLTTYGTLRRDAAFLKDFEFDYVILDEAQAIKNATTEAAKATRLLHGKHKLALSGTPIENHLGELWSLFDFLNPGMLGRVGRFAGLAKEADVDQRKLLASAVRPFILRRTKKEVAPELPDRVEQTVIVELDAEQRKSYDELRAHYQQSLLQKIDTDGIAKSQILILEALLRLRQAACHPGLIDKARAKEPSAKLDELLERLNNAAEAGERVLVFSQFTSLLAIVKAKLKTLPAEILYLDGKTKNRQALVDEFQNGTGPAVFLISLKAGGVGLNLTAARYVYLLDPWWNPAVEAQAIDRVHRIGQQQTVFATRLIAADTVEQKVLELQSKKKGLADAIINADNAGVSSLTREDVAMLLA